MLYIFDMGGVVTSTANVIPRLCDMIGISTEQFYAYCGCEGGTPSYMPGSADLLSRCSDGTLCSREFWREFSARSGKRITTDWWHWLFHPELNKKTVGIIKALRERGNRIVCGTNTIDSHYANHLERGDYLFFDQTYASFLMGVSKPNPEFWRIILTAEQVQAQDAVFIDDRKENCDGAARLGIRAIQFTSAEQLASVLEAGI